MLTPGMIGRILRVNVSPSKRPTGLRAVQQPATAPTGA
jgi:hypothetical protein